MMVYVMWAQHYSGMQIREFVQESEALAAFEKEIARPTIHSAHVEKMQFVTKGEWATQHISTLIEFRADGRILTAV